MIVAVVLCATCVHYYVLLRAPRVIINDPHPPIMQEVELSVESITGSNNTSQDWKRRIM